MCLLYMTFFTLFLVTTGFNLAIMSGLFALELIKLIFTVSICPSSYVYLSSSTLSCFALPCGLLYVLCFSILLQSDSSCHIPYITSHPLGILNMGDWIHSIYPCLFCYFVFYALIFSAFLIRWHQILVCFQTV